jgi:hypothetical protein
MVRQLLSVWYVLGSFPRPEVLRSLVIFLSRFRQGEVKVKVKVQLSLCLTKYHAMITYYASIT